ncbi:spermatogenesis-associated protein 6-like [Watersipora subatra]|uniref:spermatogenesis-associated protein 6-like n=1 Tax=Watersipora subatra TaxID=2589382 RepID=UPI00355BF76F
MPRKAQKLYVELTVSRVSCPGVWLRNTNELYLSICLFGKYQRTSLVEPVFPAIIMEKFKFDKVFYTAVDPAEVSDLLEDEDVIFELVQLSPDSPEGAVLLASFQRNVRDFLYPYPQLLPSYGSADREVLMEKSWDFPGIAPRLEFGSHAKIKEVKIPKYMQSSLNTDFLPVGRSVRARARSPSPRTYMYPDSEEEGKGYQDPTVASITRSQSLSPSRKTRYKSLANRPPFLIQRLDDSVIHRKPGSPSPRSKKGMRTQSAQTSLRRPCSRVQDSAAAPPYYSDEESDVEYTGSYRRRQTRSVPEITLPPRRSVSPVTYRRSLRERYLDNETVDEEWRRRRVERAERALAESLASSYRARSLVSYDDSLEDLADDFDRSRLFGY